MSKTILLTPHMSEKSYALSQTSNVYVFDVPRQVNKLTIARAVAEQFKVSVTSVNIASVKGKPKRTVRKGGITTAGYRLNTKKAFVTLQEGNKIAIFDAPEDAKEKGDAKQETLAQQDKKAQPEVKRKRSFRSALGRAPRQVQNRGGEK